jgi:hypothetical protein
VLDPEETATITASVQIPAAAPGMVDQPIQLTAYSAIDPTAAAVRTVTVAVAPRYGFEVSVDALSRAGNPNQEVAFGFTVRATGNMASAHPAAWGIWQWMAGTPSRELRWLGSQGLASGDLVAVTAPVAVPDWPDGGAVLAYEFFIVSNSTGINVSSPFEVVVNVLCGGAWAIPERVTLSPEGATLLSGLLENAGNVNITATASVVSAPAGWGVEVVPPGPSAAFALPRAEARALGLAIHATPFALAGGYPIALRVDRAPCAALSVDVVATVPAVPTFSISPARAVLEALPGDVVSAAVVVENTGNVPLVLQVVAEGSVRLDELEVLVEAPGGAFLLLPASPLELGVHENATLRVRARVPVDLADDLFHVKVRASASGGGERVADIYVIVSRSNLHAAGVSADLLLVTEGDSVRLTLTVANRGIATSPGATVRCLDGGIEYGSVSIAALEPEGTATAECVWIASAGSHDLAFVVVEDAGGTELERDNSFTYALWVDPAPAASAAGGSAWVLVGGAAAAAAALGAAGLTAVHRRRARPPNR